MTTVPAPALSPAARKAVADWLRGQTPSPNGLWTADAVARLMRLLAAEIELEGDDPPPAITAETVYGLHV